VSEIDDYIFHAFDVLEDQVASRGAESLEGEAKIVLPMLIEVDDPNWNRDLPGFTELSRIDNIIACTGTRETIRVLSDDPSVISVEASRRPSGLECNQSLPFVKADIVHSCPSLAEKGDQALIAIIDNGIDVLHDAFIDAIGQTRIVAIWDQRDNTGKKPIGFTFGTEHTQADINGYIASKTVPPKLGRNPDGHGTHVASIAAGQQGKNFYGGLAPEAKIIVVISNISTDPNDEDYNEDNPYSLGYSTAHHAALSYIGKLADKLKMPVVINLSQGMNAGAHDGTSLLETAFDRFTNGGRKPGRVIVKSAGNERNKDIHAALDIVSDQLETLRWECNREHPDYDVIELWFKACNHYQFRLHNPNNNSSRWVDWNTPRDRDIFLSGNKYEITYKRYHHDNGDSRLMIVVKAGNLSTVQMGEWKLEILGIRVKSRETIHAWIERNSSRPIHFINHQSPDLTLSIPATARTVVSVGAVNSSNPLMIPIFSSYGPTRDSREKPDVMAPGASVYAARGGTLDDIIKKEGTSMAAPHVTGAIALLFSHWWKRQAQVPKWEQLDAAQIRAALTQTTQSPNVSWNNSIGYGVLDVEKLVTAFD